MDLNILPLARQGGQDLVETPGLLVSAPPRRTARGRQSDYLVLHFAMEGTASLTPAQQSQLLARLAQTYYKSAGSVTSAQRVIADELNQSLLDRNLRGASSGLQGIGLLSIATLRSQRLYLAQCGPVQAFLITARGAENFYDLQSSSRGLGLGRTTPIYYSQADIQAGDTLLLSPAAPSAWSESILAGLYNQSLDNMRRALLSQSGPDLNAVWIQLRRGSGKIAMLRPRPGSTTIGVEPATPTSIGAPAASVAATGAAPPDGIKPAVAGAASIAAASRIVSPQPAPPPPGAPPVTASETSVAQPPSRTPAEPVPAGTPSQPSTAARRRRPSVMAPVLIWLASLRDAARRMVLRMLPGEGFATIPSSVMFFIAVAVPLVVVAIAAVVYLQRGQAGIYQARIAQAAQAAGYARTQTDPNARTQAWQTVINYVEQVEEYQVTDETLALRAEANQVFDELKSVQRLDYQPAIANGIPDNAVISQLVATETDLYLLNTESSSVLRAFSTSSGYTLDPQFQCAQGFPAGQTGQLVDIAAAPAGNSFNATLQALDIAGNLLQCLPDQPPVFTPLAPPAKGWGKPLALTVDLGNLYVLDAEKKTVWVYWNSSYTEPPEEFFFADFPVENVIDLAVDKNDLYLLHTDGHTTLCSYSSMSVSPSRCTDPAAYLDSRPGHESQVMALESPFTQLLATQPPDPSLYYLQPSENAIYRYSLRLLTYYGQYRPQINPNTVAGIPDKPASAFTLKPGGRFAYLAIGNQVYYAGIP